MRALPVPGVVDPRWPIVGVGALSVGLLAVVLDWRLLVPIGLGLPLVAVVVLDEMARDGGATGAYRPEATVSTRASMGLLHEGVIAVAWALWFFRLHIALLGVPGAAGTLLRSGARVLIHALPLVILLEVLRRGWPGRTPRLALVLSGFTLFAVASVAWSRAPIESAERALQWVLIVGLATYCASRAVAEPGFGDRLLTRFLRYITWGAVALGGWGVITGLLGEARFTVPGQHPNTAAAFLLVPCLGLLFHPRRAFITRPVPWWVVVTGLGFLSYATASRTTVAAGMVAVASGWFIATTRDSRVGMVGAGLGLVLTGTVVGVASEQLSAWLHRGQSTETLVGLNGRVELWRWVLENPLGSEVWGVGVGAARGAMQVSWDARALHSAWIDLLQSLGVVGLALMGAVVVATLAMAVVRQSAHAAWMLGFVVVVSIAELAFAGPGYSLVLLCLAITVVSDSQTRSNLDGLAALAGTGASRPHHRVAEQTPR